MNKEDRSSSESSLETDPEVETLQEKQDYVIVSEIRETETPEVKIQLRPISGAPKEKQ